MSRTTTFCALTLAALLTVAGTAGARPPPRSSLYQMIDFAFLGDPIVVHGRVASVGSSAAGVKVERVIRGKVNEDVVFVRPVDMPQCLGDRKVIFKVGEEVVIFFWRAKEGAHRLVDDWQGRRAVPPEKRATFIAAVERLLEVFSRKDEDVRNRAMLALASSRNDILRAEALRYVRNRIGGSKLRESYAYDVLRLLGSADPAMVFAGACAAVAFEAPEVFGAVTRMCSHEKAEVRTAAASALGQAPPARAELAIPALLEVLRRENAEERDQEMAVYSLDQIDRRADRRARDLLEPEIPLLDRLLRREWYEARHAVSILARRTSPEARRTLERAAKTHPRSSIRDRARNALAE